MTGATDATRVTSTPGMTCPVPPAEGQTRHVPLTFTACGSLSKLVKRSSDPVYIVLLFYYENECGCVQSNPVPVNAMGCWTASITLPKAGVGNLYAHQLTGSVNDLTCEMILGRSQGISSVHDIEGDETLGAEDDPCSMCTCDDC